MSEIDRIAEKCGMETWAALNKQNWVNVPGTIADSVRAALLEYGAIVREENKRLIADDAFCIQFQTIGQYRKALLDAHQG